MTYGYGPSASGGDGPQSRGRRRAQQQPGGPAPSSPAGYGPQSYGPADEPPSQRYPSPPPPARLLGGAPRRPTNSGSQPPAYPAYPPPVPTSPTVPRGGPPRPVPPRPPEPPTGGMRTGGFAPPRPAPGRPGAPKRPARRELPPLATGPKVPRSVQLRNAVPGLIRHLPHHKPWMVALSVIAIAVVLGTCGLGSYLLFKDDRQLVAVPDTTPTVPMRDITSRVSDPLPMTAADVFPSDKIMAADATVPPYQRLGDPQINTNCKLAASGDLATVLIAAGCNQYIRATFVSTDGAYLVTAGIFNLKDATAADQAETQIRSVDASKGRFSGYISDKDKTKIFGRAATQVAWDADGHFLLYAVIARVDGKEVAPSDPNISVIVYDVVEHYLRDHVIVAWATDRSSATPGGSLAASSPATR